MAANPLVELQKLGQSIWYDNIRRSLILTGDLQAKIEGDALRGVTSNPAIFEKAMQGHRRRQATQRSPATPTSPKGGGGTVSISLSLLLHDAHRHLVVVASRT